MITKKLILILVIFIITIALVYNDYFWLAFIFLVISILTLDFFNKSFFKNSFEKLKSAQGSYPEGKLKSYSNITGSKITKFAGKPHGTESALKADMENAIPKGADNFFKEIKEIFK